MSSRHYGEITWRSSQNLSQDAAEKLLLEVARRLGLAERLELQASFAGYMGHRQRVGQYSMSVNARDDYQFIPPHSEGDSFMGMQLAAFYCFENSTDAGEPILFNVRGEGEF